MRNDCSNNAGCSCSANTSVKCSVNNCANHCRDNEYCGLDTVEIGTHESNPTEKKCVDCNSFEMK